MIECMPTSQASFIIQLMLEYTSIFKIDRITAKKHGTCKQCFEGVRHPCSQGEGMMQQHKATSCGTHDIAVFRQHYTAYCKRSLQIFSQNLKKNSR